MALTSNYDPKATQDSDDKTKRVNGQEKSAVDTMNYGPKKLKDSKQPEDQNKYTDNPKQDGEHNDKKETTGNYTGKKEGEKIYTHYRDCPPGKNTEEYLKAEADKIRAQGYMSPVEVKCKDKTDTKKGAGQGLVSGAGDQALPNIDVAGRGQLQGAGKMVTNPVDLQNKVVNYQGQQYFNPQSGLPSAPSGYSWQGRDFATLVNTVTNTALSVPQTLALFNGQAQSSARTPTTGSSGTNPVTPTRFPLTTSTSGGVTSSDAKFAPSDVKSGAVTMKDRVSLARAAGFSENQAVLMGAISQAESRGNSLARNPYGRDDSYGLWQINMLGSMGVQRDALFRQNIPGYVNRNSLYNPWINAQAAKIIYNQQGFSAWSTYSSGAYRPFYADAQSGTGLGSSGGSTGISYNTNSGGSATPIGGGSAAGGGGGGGAGIGSSGGSSGGSASGGSGGGMGGGGSLGLTYQRPQQEGQGGYIAQAAAATIAARTGGLGSLSSASNLAGGMGGMNLGGLASSALGGWGGQTPSGSVTPNYNVPNWSSGSLSAATPGINPASAIGTIPNNSATLFPTSMSDFSSVGNNLGSVPNAYTNLPTSAPLASTSDLNSNLGAAANQSGLVPQTPTGTYGQFGQSITGAGGGGSSTKKEGKAESTKQTSTRPTETTKYMNRGARKKSNDDKELDKELDKKVPLPPKRPEELSKPITHAVTRRKTEGDEGPENQSVGQAPGVDPHAFTSDMSGAARNLSGAIPGLESLMSRLPNNVLGQFMGNMPAGLQSLLPQGLIPGLNLGPVSLNNMLQMVGGGALGGAAGQMIRSMAGGIPVASMLTQSLQAVPLTQVFGALGQDIGTSAAAIANTLGSITNVASRGLSGGIPVNSAQLNQAISYAVASSGSSLSIPINTLGIASQVVNNPIGSLVNIAMGNMISNGSVPIVPTNLSGTNAALLAGLNQQIPQDDAQMILTIGQITNLLPPNVRNLIPQVSPSAFGGPTNAVQNNRNNSARQTDPSQVHGGGGGGGNQLDFQSADKTNIGDTRNIPYGMKLSEHYTLYDLTTGVAVSHGCHPLRPLHGMTVDEVVQNLMLLARNILEPIRANIGPFTINSGFRGDDNTTKGNPNWQRSLHGYGRAADLSWGSSGRIAQAHAFAAARLHATENLHEGTWLHIAVAGGTGGKGGNAQTRTPEGNIQQGVNTYKGYPGQVQQ